MSAPPKAKVFRLRNLPGHLDRFSAIQLLSRSLEGIEERDILMSPLATDIRRLPYIRTQVATLIFRTTPPMVTAGTKQGDITIHNPALAEPLILDDHFGGVTPLNSVTEHEHTHNCLVLSGLGSHAFGSWQPHGQDKDFMWIRDELPHSLPGVRFMIYGYDTTLLGSQSFQTIPHLANSLINTMRTIGWSEPSSKPILFLAHSLGGVVLKNALITLAGAYEREHAILNKIQGAVFFGVPSRGIAVPDLFAMVDTQPNIALLNDLSDKSDYLPRMDQQFAGISELQRIPYYWAYETKTTPTVSSANGRFTRTGQASVMVSVESATRGLCITEPSRTIQIDENHSNIVKFPARDHRIGIVADKLKDLCDCAHSRPAGAQPYTFNNFVDHTDFGEEDGDLDINLKENRIVVESESDLGDSHGQFWNHARILKSIRAPQRDDRLHQIDKKLENTFEWAFDDDSTTLKQWLLEGTGIFWIRGKPASGKSTLMKYLYQDMQTSELIRAGNKGAKLMKLSFFFHHRGTTVQKSFEGLLRSLVSQILEQEDKLFTYIYPKLNERYKHRISAGTLGDLENDIWNLLRKFDDQAMDMSKKRRDRVQKIVASEAQLSAARLDDQLRQLLEPCKKSSIQQGTSLVKEPILKNDTAEIVRRHSKRMLIKFDIQNESWTQDRLEETLIDLLSQDRFKLDIFLFLDALDEYDGRPEFIASFLHSLDKCQSKSTRLRILFSSRPWKVYNREFATKPGFQIQDHTQHDIEELCASRIPQNDVALSLLGPFIPQIVARACGVFLWVILVMRELTGVLDRMDDETNNAVRQELGKRLDSLPDELHQFYRHIVKRIPISMRWETYVILEVISRCQGKVERQMLLDTVDASSVQTASEVRNYIELGRYRSTQLARETGSQLKEFVEAATGGLVEIIPDGAAPEASTVQFMHQSVQDFVKDLDLKALILGPARSRVVHENGFSFLSKQYFIMASKCHSSSPPYGRSRGLGQFEFALFGYYARQAEHTTGFSQYEIFAVVPGRDASFSPYPLQRTSLGRIFRRPGFPPPQKPIHSVLELAISLQLKQCFNDACEAPSQYLVQKALASDLDSIGFIISLLQEKIEERVSTWIVLGPDRSRPVAFACDVAKSLIAHGLKPVSNLDGLSYLLSGLFVSCFSFEKGEMPGANAYQQLAITLLQEWGQQSIMEAVVDQLPPDTAPFYRSVEAFDQYSQRSLLLMKGCLMLCLRSGGGSVLANYSRYLESQTLLDLFLSTALARYDQNARSKRSLGMLVASCARKLKRYKSSQAGHDGTDIDCMIWKHVHDHMCLVAQFGGRFGVTKKSDWNLWTRCCAENGLDRRAFKKTGLPSWTNGCPPEDGPSGLT